MGKGTHDPGTPWGRVTEGAKGAEKVQVHVGGKRPAVCSFSKIIGYQSTILLLPVFLFEQFIWFKLRAVKEGRSYEMETSAKFLETFMGSDFED